MRRLREQNGASGCSDGSAGPEPCRAQRDAAKSTQRKTNMATAGYAVAGVALAATVGYWLWAQPGSTPNQAGLAGARLDDEHSNHCTGDKSCKNPPVPSGSARSS
jgi:hypothetical protein